VQVLVLGQNPYHPQPLNENQRAALKLIADHREKHPYQVKSQGTNQMVQDALKAGM